jgi:hypothetical protein
MGVPDQPECRLFVRRGGGHIRHVGLCHAPLQDSDRWVCDLPGNRMVRNLPTQGKSLGPDHSGSQPDPVLYCCPYVTLALPLAIAVRLWRSSLVLTSFLQTKTVLPRSALIWLWGFPSSALYLL